MGTGAFAVPIFNVIGRRMFGGHTGNAGARAGNVHRESATRPSKAKPLAKVDEELLLCGVWRRLFRACILLYTIVTMMIYNTIHRHTTKCA